MFPATQSLAPPFHPTHHHFSSSFSNLPTSSSSNPPTSSSSNPPTSSSRCRFAEPKTDEEVHRERTLWVSKKTFEDTQYCFRLWEAWKEHRNIATAVQIGSIVQKSNSELQHWLTLFIQKAGRQHVSTGKLAPHYCWFDDTPQVEWKAPSRPLPWLWLSWLSGFTRHRDAKASAGGSFSQKETSRSAHWSQQGADVEQRSPRRYHSTELARHSFFYNGPYFALRSGKQHWQLRSSRSEIQVIERQGERPYLCYTEDIFQESPRRPKMKKA